MREGKRIRTKHLEVRAAASFFVPLSVPKGCLRVGLVIPRFNHSAVLRNLVKRRIRELVRVHLVPADIPIDVVVRIRPEAYRATFPQLASEIVSLIPQIHRWFDNVKSEQVPPSEMS